MRLLVVEDDRELSLLMKAGLEGEGFLVDVANLGVDGELKAVANAYDAILLDLNLPDKDGLDILAYLRENGVAAPVLIVTARDQVHQRAFGLNSGADDYVIKPFDFIELNARIRAVIRRSYGRNKSQIEVGRVRVCPQTREAFINEAGVDLSAKEFDILEYLASRSPEAVSGEDIAEHVYDENFDPFSSVLRVHIANLRKKLDAAGGTGVLVTLKGRGYRLCG